MSKKKKLPVIVINASPTRGEYDLLRLETSAVGGGYIADYAATFCEF